MAERATIKITVSSTGLFHRVHQSGVSTFCGLDLSMPIRRHWEVWEEPLTDHVMNSMCQRCMPERRPT